MLCICPVFPVPTYYPALGDLFPKSCIYLNLPSLCNRCSTIKHKWKFFICGHSKGERICSKHILYTKSGGNRGSCICSCHPYHSIFYSHKNIISGNTVMVRVSYHSHTHTIFFCLIYCHLHGMFGYYLSHAIVSIYYSSRRTLFYYFHIRNRIYLSYFYSIYVYRLKSPHTMGVYPSFIRGYKYICTYLCILFGDTYFFKYIYHKIF